MIESRRTLLYYPTIEVPDGPWLRQALLYFDEVASIFPAELTWSWEDLGAIGALPDHMALLQSEGLYRRIAPESLLRTEHGDDWPRIHELTTEFIGAISTDAYRRRLGKPEAFQYTKVHEGKLSGTVLQSLVALGLSKPERHIEDHHYWIYVEVTTARLYLGLLAVALAEKENADVRARLLTGGLPQEVGIVATGTDRQQHEALVWKTESQTNPGDPYVEARWLGLLPTPGPEVRIEDIIDFKRKRHEELLRLRVEMDKLGEELATHDRPERIAVAWSERVKVELSTIARLMGESRWRIAWGSLKAILDIKPLGLIEAVATVAHLPVQFAAGGLAVNGIVEIGTQCIEHGRRKAKVLDGSPFAYLFNARQSGMFD